MAMTKEQEEKLNQIISEQFNKIKMDALLVGSKAMCAVILEKAQKEGKTDKEKLDDIINYCSSNLKRKAEVK